MTRGCVAPSAESLFTIAAAVEESTTLCIASKQAPWGRVTDKQALENQRA